MRRNQGKERYHREEDAQVKAIRSSEQVTSRGRHQERATKKGA